MRKIILLVFVLGLFGCGGNKPVYKGTVDMLLPNDTIPLFTISGTQSTTTPAITWSTPQHFTVAGTWTIVLPKDGSSMTTTTNKVLKLKSQ